MLFKVFSSTIVPKILFVPFSFWLYSFNFLYCLLLVSFLFQKFITVSVFFSKYLLASDHVFSFSISFFQPHSARLMYLVSHLRNDLPLHFFV